MVDMTVGVVGTGVYFPKLVEVAADLVAATQIPENILMEKMGIRQRHVADDTDTVSYMASEAARSAIAKAGISPEAINMVISHGSEYKDQGYVSLYN